MTRYEDLMARILRGDRIGIDGGTGTEMERRGVPKLTNAWNGGAALSHPDIVREVHSDYIRAGANVIISNTFATGRNALNDAGVADDFEALNRRGVELAIEAREAAGRDEVVVAGGISHWTWSGNAPSLDEQYENTLEQVTIMAGAGAELLILEMMIDIARMKRVLDAAKTTDLPIWVGFSTGEEDGSTDWSAGVTLRGGELLTDAIAALDDYNIDVVTIMHSDVGVIDGCLDVIDQVWDGPVGVYAHSGDYIDGEWIFDDVISPEDYAELCRGWVDRGVRIIGGCCGTRPEHIREIAHIEGVT
jgi:S-methylmethionine-dependent homocysteine/selenocysteine methylase